MAPRRSARSAAATPAPATQPLEDCVLAFVGRFTSEGYSHAKLNTLTSSLGGRTSKSVTKDTTHLIYTINDYDPMTTNWITAKNKDIPIVTLQWLIECEKEQAKVNEVPFQANASAAAVAAHKKDEAAAGKASSKTSAATTVAANGAKTDVVTNRKKRAASEKAEDDDDDEPEPPKTKKAKETKSKAKANGKKADVKEEEDADEVLEEETPVAEGQFLKKKGTSIPVDSLWMEPGYQVHVGDDGMIWDASLNQANSANNNNKFYILQILHNPKTNTYKTWSRWGRVGESGQNASLGNGSLDDAIKQFEKKFKDKSGLTWENRGNDPKPNKYAFVERSYESDSEEDEEDEVKPKEEGGDDEVLAPVCTLEKPVMDLMNLIFNQEYFQATMSALNYDAKKLPLGKLSKATITRGFQQLKDLAALMNDWSLAQSKWGMTPAAATQHLSNTYYSLIPHAFGRNRPPVINDGNLLKNEIELLESLSDMKDAADIMKVDKKAIDNVHTLDRHFQGLNLNEMSVLDKTTDEFTLLAKYLNDSRGSTHNMTYKIQDIFRIERQGEHARFDESEFGSMKSSNRRLLWHGSRCTNFGGILSQGLRIAPPEAPVTGYMFGKGIYLADMSSKSAGYCASGLSQGNALLLLCEAELGDPMQELTQASYEAGETAKKQGMVSTWGKGRTGPSKWIDAEAVHPSLKGVMMPDVEVTPGSTGVQGASLYYNEYICYDVSQIKLRYLLRVKI